MTQVATPETVIPDMDGLELTLDSWRYRVDRHDGGYWVTASPHFERPRNANTPSRPSSPRRIVLLTGSHNQQNYWLETADGRTLEAFPFAWNVAERIWAPVADTFLCPPEENHASRSQGVWNNTCLTCHTTQGRPMVGRTTPFDSRVAEFGISCESCHGEGEEHVERHQNPITRYFARLDDEPDPTIANPARMNGARSALVCGQCHSIWAFESAAAMAGWNRDGVAYRSGDDVLDDRFVVQPGREPRPPALAKIIESDPHFVEDSFWSDGMVRVTGREYNGLELSPCFKGGDFSCLSCHEMHPENTDTNTLRTWAVSQMKSEARSDAACLQCHQGIASDISTHTHHPAESAGSRCYDCHMPHSSFGLLRAVRSHQVSSPTAQESSEIGRPNACNLCHLDKPLAWTAEKLALWYDQPAPYLPKDDHEIAAGAKWILQGHAGQRALAAWSMGWAPAQSASGRDWIAPYLAVTLNDPYAAVRFAAWKSLQTIPGFETFRYEYTAPDHVTFEAGTRAYQLALHLNRSRTSAFPAPTLLDSTGRIQPDLYDRLLNERDNRRIFLVE